MGVGHEIWTQVADMGPSVRIYHSMAYDSNSKKIILFGGGINAGYANDTWEWDGTEWTPVPDTGPSVRAVHSMVYDDEKNVAVMFGGIDDASNILGDTWELKIKVKT